jgi:hypothetical protein
MPPPHWPTVPEVVQPFQARFDACEALIAFSVENYPHDRFSRSDLSREEVLLLWTYARSTKTYQAALRLAFVGYGVQATMIGRSLFEDMVLAHWIDLNPAEAIDLFDRHRLFQIGEYSRLERKHGQEHPAAGEWDILPDEQQKAIRGEFARTRTWWKKPLRAIVEDIESSWDSEDRKTLWRLFDLVHHRSNNVLHHSAVGISPSLEETPQGDRIVDMGSSTAYLYVALPMMFFSYSALLSLVFSGSVRERLVELSLHHAQAAFDGAEEAGVSA